MKKNILIVALVLIALVIVFALITAFTPSTEKIHRPQVAATIFPIYDITRTVAGDEIDVSLILPPGASPHTFDPSPSALRELQHTKTVFAVGHSLDEWVYPLVEQSDNASVVVVDAGITIKEAGHEEHNEHEEEYHDHELEDGDKDANEEHTHDHGPTDPHYWLNPHNAITIAHTVAAELAKIAPEHEGLFLARAQTFEHGLEKDIVVWKQDLDQIKGAKLITLHDAFSYLADFATLELVVTFEPFPGKEPTAQYLRILRQEVEEHNVQAIFSEPQLSTSGIESFAQDAGIAIGILDPLGGTDNRQSYRALIEYNVRSLIATLH